MYAAKAGRASTVSERDLDSMGSNAPREAPKPSIVLGTMSDQTAGRGGRGSERVLRRYGRNRLARSVYSLRSGEGGWSVNV